MGIHGSGQGGILQMEVHGNVPEGGQGDVAVGVLPGTLRRHVPYIQLRHQEVGFHGGGLGQDAAVFGNDAVA